MGFPGFNFPLGLCLCDPHATNTTINKISDIFFKGLRVTEQIYNFSGSDADRKTPNMLINLLLVAHPEPDFLTGAQFLCFLHLLVDGDKTHIGKRWRHQIILNREGHHNLH